MVDGILVGIFGSTAYEILKKLVKRVFNDIHEEEPIINKTYQAVERTCQRFFDKYKNEFGPPHDSFLSREENHETLIRRIYLDSKGLTINDLNPNSFRGAPKATNEALKFLIEAFEEELRADRELAKELETIKHHRQMDHVISVIDKLQEPKDQKLPQLLTPLPPRKIRLIGRKEDLKNLEQRLKETDRVLLVNGLGGIGKTEVCKQYFMDHYKKFSFAGWFDYVSSIKMSLVNGIDWDSQTAKLFMAKNEKDTPDVRFRKIMDFFKNLEKNALLVLDNIEDADDEDLDKLMALPPHVKVIANSRMHIEGFDSHDLDFLSAADCKALFYEFYKGEKDDAVVDKIVDLCGRHTLTVELLARTAQVAAMPVKVLYDKLKDKGFDLNAAIGVRVGTFWRNEKERKPIFNHLLKIFDLSGVTESERHLLTNLAVLPAVYIHIDEFCQWLEPVLTLRVPFLTDNNNLQHHPNPKEEIDGLVRKGWLRRDGLKIFMHPVIQEVIRYSTEPDADKCKNLIVSLKYKMHYEPGENPLDKKEYIIFAESVLQRIDKNNQDLSDLSNNLANIYYHLGQFEEALIFQLKAVKIDENILGKNHPSLANGYNNIAEIYRVMGQLEKALEFQLKALSIREKVSDKNNPNLAASYDNIAKIYYNLGQYEKALEFQLKALEIDKNTLDKNHPNLATSYNNLGGIYRSMGKMEKALEFLLKALEINENTLDKNHPYLATFYYNLSLTYLDLKDYQTASQYGEKAVAILQGLFPQGNPDLEEYKRNLEKIERERG